jgi:hypothetical protein
VINIKCCYKSAVFYLSGLGSAEMFTVDILSAYDCNILCPGPSTIAMVALHPWYGKEAILHSDDQPL